MARPKNADATVTRGRILAAARSLFASKGLGGTSTRDIAKEAGVSVATVHHYFGTKEALFEATNAALWQGMGSVHKAFVHAIDDDDDLPTLVDKCVRVAFAFARDNRDGTRLLLRRVLQTGSMFEPPKEDGEAENSDFLHGFVRNTATLLAGATGRRIRSARLELSTVVFLVIRYALAEPAEIARLLDIDLADTNEDAVLQALEDHLVQTCLRVLAIER